MTAFVRDLQRLMQAHGEPLPRFGADGAWGDESRAALDRLVHGEGRLTPSQSIRAFVRGFEKCRLEAYLPTKNDVPTIGWGSTGPDIKLGMKWTQAQADARFDADALRFAAAVNAALDGAPTLQRQFDAMWSLAYNIGEQAFRSSTLLRLHKAGNFAGAAEQFQRWNRQDGQVLAGLTARRLAEAAIYRGERTGTAWPGPGRPASR